VTHFAPDPRAYDPDDAAEASVRLLEHGGDVGGVPPLQRRRRFLPFLVAASAVVVIGAALAVGWHYYGAQASIPSDAPSPGAVGEVQAAPSTEDVENLKSTINQLSASQQQIAETMAAVQTSLREIQQTAAQHQADIQRLSDSLSSLVPKVEPVRKPAAKPPPAPQRAQAGGENHPAAATSRGSNGPPAGARPRMPQRIAPATPAADD
jgi:uncharacterized coiled-coil protein SlyX